MSREAESRPPRAANARGLVTWCSGWAAKALMGAMVALGTIATGCLGPLSNDASSTPEGFVDAVATSTSQFGSGPFGGTEVATQAGSLVHLANGFVVVDPLATSPSNDFPYSEIFSGLVRFGDGLDPEPEGDLASGWVVSDDGKRYVFSLRDGVRFSDGRPVTAHDVKWSWERSLQAEYVGQRAVEIFGAVVGARDVLEGRAQTISGLKVVDDQTLIVDLVIPRAHFVQSLADPLASVLSRTNVENWGTLNWTELEQRLVEGFLRGDLDFNELPVGTGPFRVARLVEADLAVLEPNPFSQRKVPNFERLLIVANTAYGLDLAGLRGPLDFEGADIVWAGDSSFAADRVVERPDQGSGDDSVQGYVKFVGQDAPSVSFLALNSALKPFDDVDFRRALFYSARRPPLSTIVYEGFSDEAADGLVPPGVIGHRRSVSPNRPDRVVAEASMAAARSRTPELDASLEVLDDGSSPFVGIYWLMMQDWQEWLGVEVDDNSVPGFEAEDYESWTSGNLSGHYSSAPTIEFGRLLDAGQLQMRYVHVQPRYPDPCAILCRIPDLFGDNAQSDETRELRAMLDDAAATADRAARIAKYQAIEDHILDRALVIPVFWDDGETYRLVKPYISGYKVPAYGGSRYEDVVVDTTHPDYPPERLGSLRNE